MAHSLNCPNCLLTSQLSPNCTVVRYFCLAPCCTDRDREAQHVKHQWDSLNTPHRPCLRDDFTRGANPCDCDLQGWRCTDHAPLRVPYKIYSSHFTVVSALTGEKQNTSAYNSQVMQRTAAFHFCRTAEHGTISRAVHAKPVSAHAIYLHGVSCGALVDEGECTQRDQARRCPIHICGERLQRQDNRATCAMQLGHC